MKRSRENSPSTVRSGAAGAPRAVAQANADHRAFSNLKTKYRQRFAQYLYSIWANTRGVRSAVFIVANKRAVLTLSSRKDGVYQTNLNNPDPKFMHLAVLNEATDTVLFSVAQGVPYDLPPTNQSVYRAVASLANFVPLEYLPPQIQPQPVTAASGENLAKKIKALQQKLRF